MIKAAIFDMDGTLVDNTSAHIRAFELFCARYGVEEWRRKLDSAFGMGNDDIMRLIMPEEVIREKGLPALAEEKEAIYRELYAPEIVPVPGLVGLLEKLRDAGIRCAVGSSGCRKNVDFVLAKCGIAGFFEQTVCGDMVTRCKPDPEIYLTAGIEAADRAGAGCIVAIATTLDRTTLETETAADLVVDDFRSAEVPFLLSNRSQRSHV